MRAAELIEQLARNDRSLAHAGYHVGQIVQLARFLAKDQWTTLTVPRGGSEAYNRAMREKHGKHGQ